MITKGFPTSMKEKTTKLLDFAMEFVPKYKNFLIANTNHRFIISCFNVDFVKALRLQRHVREAIKR